MFNRLGVPGVLALLVFVGSLAAALWGGKPVVAWIAVAVSGVFVLTRLFRGGDA